MATQISCGIRPKFIQNRAHDYLYDPVFTVSAPKDYVRQVMIARKLTAKYAICPVFQCMFSDLPNYPRQTVVRRVTKELIKTDLAIKKALQGSVCEQIQKNDIGGTDRHRFFSRPIVEFSTDIISYTKQPVVQIQLEDKLPKKPRNKQTQTVFRESSAQTKPWKTPNYIVPEGTDPELLKLDFLQDCMLPAGVHEIELIKRARVKRAWEKVLKLLSDSDTYEERRNIIEAMETDEWIYREREINDIQNLRMELLEKMLQEILDLSSDKVNKRIMRKTEELKKVKEEQLEKIQHYAQRELRRLYRQHHGIITKYRKMNIIEEHRDHKSEIYVPLMRHGVNPSRRHEKIILSDYSPQLQGIEFNTDTLPKWLHEMKVSDEKIEVKGRHLCQRETKWTEPILKKIHDELKHINEVVKKKSCLWKTRNKSDVFEFLPAVQDISNRDETDNLSAIFLQSVIRGRTTQTTIFEGRDKCRELINELKSTFFLQEVNSKQVKKERFNTYNQQRMQEFNQNCQTNLTEMLSKLEGTVVGTMLDFLNKELRRILDERKAHAVALLAKRERYMKEAAEAGRRQVEERRRREHDEIFKQLTKIHQDTVDMYLQDIILEGIESVSEEKAHEYIKNLAEKMDEELEEQEDISFLDKEETIADMVHHFVIPEVEKINIRQRITNKQKNYLRTVHSTIYDKLDSMEVESDDESSSDTENTK